MRYIDWNGDGGLDPQDIATSVVVEETTRETENDDASKQLETSAGCATLAAFIAIPLLIILITL